MIRLIKIIENIILGLVKLYVMAGSMLMVSLDDSVDKLSVLGSVLIICRCLLFVVVIDCVVNYILCFLLKNKFNVTFKSLLITSLSVTGCIFAFMLIVLW